MSMKDAILSLCSFLEDEGVEGVWLPEDPARPGEPVPNIPLLEEMYRWFDSDEGDVIVIVELPVATHGPIMSVWHEGTPAGWSILTDRPVE